MKLTLNLSKDFSQVEKLYRLMCFNVFAHNRDDHSKNFSFLYDEEQKNQQWSPAYDLTYSNSIGGEHVTTVHGNGKNPGMKEILEVAALVGLSSNKAKDIADQVKQYVFEDLKKYLFL